MDKQEWQKRGAGHRSRLRDRFLEHGLNGFTDAEIVELLLTFGTPRSDCKQPARELLDKFGSLAAVLEAPAAELAKIKGVGKKNSFALPFIQAVAGRYLKNRLKGKRYLHSAAEVRDYLLHSMRGLRREVFTVIYLDSSHAIIESEVVSEGTVNVSKVYPRELVIKALAHHAAAIIVAHNHPSGSVSPSGADLKLTQNLHLIGMLMQINLLDHLIIGDEVYSFAGSGRMAEIKRQNEQIISDMR
ncbi:MAG: hypothetical protein CSB24_03300 [Deltaproteobacteria bacterium]|nr:MAG: hypothetical protein CSB24_03300 [Deltaproteobacteria bacterium]